MYDQTKITTIPKIDLPATYRSGSNKYAGKIVAVSKSGHRCTWERTYEAGQSTDVNATAWRQDFTRRKNGGYEAVGHGAMFDLVLGVAHTDIDEGF